MEGKEANEESASSPHPCRKEDNPPATDARVPHPSQSHREGWDVGSQDLACKLGLAVNATTAIEVSLDAPGIRAALEDPALPKDVHDLKAIHRALEPHGIALAGVREDVMLLNDPVDPTHASHTLADVTARFTNRALAQVTKGIVSEICSPKQPTPSTASPRSSAPRLKPQKLQMSTTPSISHSFPSSSAWSRQACASTPLF